MLHFKSRILIAAVVLIKVSAPAGAALTLSTNALSTSLQMAPGESSSFQVQIFSDGTTMSNLSGWQFTLALAPLNGTGTVEFVLPGALQAPANYLFSSFEASSFAETADQLGALDSVEVAAAVEVPGSPAMNLAEIRIQSSMDAKGDIGIFAVPGQFSTLWIDDTSPAPQEIAFQNVPFEESDKVQIGTIEVLEPLLGDYNRDGAVNEPDLGVWQSEYSMADGELHADGNADGVVDGNDFLIWQRQFGATNRSLPLATLAVPEPATFGPLFCAAMAWSMLLCRVRNNYKLSMLTTIVANSE